MVYALELPVLLVLLVTASTNGTTCTSACNGVVPTILGPCKGVIAEPFCRFVPYPVEGASLTRLEIDVILVFKFRRWSFGPLKGLKQMSS